jgi:hypothetical protein
MRSGTLLRTEVVSMTLNHRQHQGLFGEAFVRVLASAAGLVVARADLDVTGEDFTISYKGTRGDKRHPKIDVQVKSWIKSNADASWRNGSWLYRMRAANFNEIAGDDFSLPRFLFVVIVPDDTLDYARCEAGQMALSHSAYWASLADHALVDPAVQATVAVKIPQENLLTVDSIRRLLHPRFSATMSAS